MVSGIMVNNATSFAVILNAVKDLCPVQWFNWSIALLLVIVTEILRSPKATSE